ncbi:MAG: hypothetical protein MTP17_04055 [Candidatus Midichloria sp.]|nr:MAG: hypothetical protein MTP17_04055 [Candidatus Midichloria sp.]
MQRVSSAIIGLWLPHWIKKLDPYLNVDPGSMGPYQHSEVFVTADGIEADLDLGYYERSTDIPASKNDVITSGKIYENLKAKKEEENILEAQSRSYLI